MKTLFEFEVNEVDDWKRHWCIKMPISETDSSACLTPDGSVISCRKCRYHVSRVVRRIGGIENNGINRERGL